MVAKQQRFQPPNQKKKRQSSSALLLLLLILIIIAIFIIAQFKSVDFLTIDKDGNVQISEDRKQKLERVLNDLENAEQYALLATTSGYYPCYNCYDTTTIYLLAGETWKYGVTWRGEKRYTRTWLINNKLVRQVQYLGKLEDCLKQERIKIVNYGVLPENLKRSKPIIRPPGNKQDN